MTNKWKEIEELCLKAAEKALQHGIAENIVDRSKEWAITAATLLGGAVMAKIQADNSKEEQKNND